MHWLYHLTKSQPPQGAIAQEVYLRAVKPGMEDAEEQEVSKTIQLYLFALDTYFGLADNPLNTEEGNRIYEQELSQKEYFIQEMKLEAGEDHLMGGATIYLKTDRFDESQLLEWIRVYLSVNGMEHDTFEKRDLGSFPEMNDILNFFSLKNVQKFEDQLGKEWWKRNDTPPPHEEKPEHTDE